MAKPARQEVTNGDVHVRTLSGSGLLGNPIGFAPPLPCLLASFFPFFLSPDIQLLAVMNYGACQISVFLS